MKNTERLSYGLLLYGYAIALGSAYIFAYWRPLGFNIFPYLTPVDLLTAPLNRLLALFAPLILLFIANAESDSKSTIKLPFFGIAIIMALHYVIGAKEIFKAFEIFFKYEFHFNNEKSVLVFCSLFLFFSFILAFRLAFEQKNTYLAVCAIGLTQVSMALATGYSDGKSIFNGAENVHYLEQKDLCEPGGIRDWVYLEKFGSNAFFMNTIDKRICIQNEIKFNLFSRKIHEGL